ncbi:MAG: hypothetical protein K2I22_13355 [Lachnospiraceae bacterium]|nr:hypothetical protein [Lachnospiraceae bacterium]
MTLVPTASKGLLMEYTMCAIRIWQMCVSQLPIGIAGSMTAASRVL